MHEWGKYKLKLELLDMYCGMSCIVLPHHFYVHHHELAV